MAQPMPASWLSEEQWNVLHGQFRPHTSSVGEFARRCANGQLSMYTKEQMLKVAQRLRRMLHEMGKFELADRGNLAGLKKHDLGLLVQAWVSDTPAAPVPAKELQDRREAIMSAFRKTRGEHPDAAVREAADVALMRITSLGVRGLDVGFLEKQLEKLESAENKKRARESSPCHVPAGIESMPPSPVRMPSQRHPSQRDPPATSTATTAPTPFLSDLEAAASRPLPPVIKSGVEFAAFESPLLRIVCSLGRIPVRHGRESKQFDIPELHKAAIHDRRLRVVLFPIGPTPTAFQPAEWPEAKTLAVQVNHTAVQIGWKRKWPKWDDRRSHNHMEKSYLPLDISSFVYRSVSKQSVILDCSAQEFKGCLVIAVAHPTDAGHVQNNHEKILLAEGAVGDRLRALSAQHMVRMYRAAAGRLKEDSDEIDVSYSIKLRCPISHQLMRFPVRGFYCEHLECFDMASALLTCHKQCFWNCPHCDRRLRLDDFCVDTKVRDAIGQAPAGTTSLRFCPEMACIWVPFMEEEAPAEPAATARSSRRRGTVALASSSDDDFAAAAAAGPGGGKDNPVVLDDD